MLHGMYTNENFQIVVIAPYQSQIDLVFRRLDQLIHSNSMLLNSRERYVKAPNYTMEFKNGSTVRGFTAGTRSGQDAGAARGQAANMLVFDEADYLSAADVDAAMAIVTNFPDATVWMSSTPTGRRERFYKTCHEPHYKEFHYPSSINPNWNAEMEQDFLNMFTQEGYLHEIKAEFGEQEEGVYQVKYVEAAQEDYEYVNCKPEKGWLYSMGVDWNDAKIGVCIAIIGFDPTRGEFRRVDEKVINRASYTQLAACDAVVQMNRMWNPFAIYVDKGFGGTQIEILNKFGHATRSSGDPSSADARLPTILKPYDFGSSIETYDPFTKQPIKKSAKAFLVENSVRQFEKLRFKYSIHDEKYTEALVGYIIKRVSSGGIPVYEQQNESAGDHMLDAVNLGLVAFTLEKTDLGKPKFETGIAFTGKLGINEATGINQPFRPQSKYDSPEVHRPVVGRADFQKASAGPGLPAANTGNGTQLPLWDWPGWGHDAPKPNGGTIGELFSRAQRRQQTRGGMRPLRPKRKMF
jgi:replicative DNA helicase